MRGIGTAIGIGVILLLVALFLILDFVTAGLDANSRMNVGWVQSEVFFAAYGVEAPAGQRSRTNLPGCFAGFPSKHGYDLRALQLDCSGNFDVRNPLDGGAGLQCDPIVGTTSFFRTLPFTSYDLESVFLAAGEGSASRLTEALAEARALSRKDFDDRYGPNSNNDGELLVYDDPSPMISSVDCGSYSIIRTVFDPSRVGQKPGATTH